MTWLGESKRAPVAAGSHRLSPRSTQPLRAACRKAGRGDVHRAGGVGDAAPVDQQLVGLKSEEPKEMVQDGVGAALGQWGCLRAVRQHGISHCIFFYCVQASVSSHCMT